MTVAEQRAREMLAQSKPDGKDHPNWSDDAIVATVQPLLDEHVAMRNALRDALTQIARILDDIDEWRRSKVLSIPDHDYIDAQVAKLVELRKVLDEK